MLRSVEAGAAGARPCVGRRRRSSHRAQEPAWGGAAGLQTMPACMACRGREGSCCRAATSRTHRVRSVLVRRRTLGGSWLLLASAEAARSRQKRLARALPAILSLAFSSGSGLPS